MNTYQEISTSKRLNRNFWNAHIKFSIAMIRSHEKHGDEKGLILARSYRTGLQRAFENRRNYEYFEGL